MIIRMSPDRQIHLDSPTDFRRFKIVVEATLFEAPQVKKAFAGFAVFEGEQQAWIDADALRNLAGSDAEWSKGFESMVELARPYGWVRDQPLRIAAHVAWTGHG